MKKLFVVAIASFLFSCGSKKESSNTENPIASKDVAFDAFKDRFMEELWKMYPGWATGSGYHKYDSVLIIPDDTYRTKELAFVKQYIDSLAGFEDASLNENNKTDKALILSTLNSTPWAINKFKSFEWDPSQYNIGGAVSEILDNKKETLENKIRTVIQKIGKLEAYYAAAKSNIKNPTKEHTELAILQLKGTVGFFETSVTDSINKGKFGAHEQDKYNADLKVAISHINGFIAHLEGILKNNQANRSFRIGKELYAEKFSSDIQSTYSADEIYQKALKRKEEILKDMSVLTKKLWPKYMKNAVMPANENEAIKALIGEIAKTHVSREKFQTEIERQIPILTKFVKDKNLLYMDPSKPLVVRKEPEWMAGVAGASISAPGPYDKEGDTFYNVGSLAAYSPEDAESFLKEYNKYILQILNIHEAIPGHYAQLVYKNQSPSIVKAIFGNGAMIEGWAVYTEKMMLEEGWDKNTELNGTAEQDEMWLMYNKWHMRVVCNTILDYSIHNLNMSKEEGLNLLMNEAFQEKAEAEGKWKRATLTQVQLCSYFTGFTEIYDFREELKKQQGKNFDLKKFHEKFLSYGSAPVTEIKKLMK
ncbi:MAG: DUF885 domain-containing protein [Bacteroidota bacterium]|nr:DUF885 domain-containing protein [Bacteroidota bacterium]